MLLAPSNALVSVGRDVWEDSIGSRNDVFWYRRLNADGMIYFSKEVGFLENKYLMENWILDEFGQRLASIETFK